MDKKFFLCLLFPLLLFFPIMSYAFDSGSTGADGAFSPTANVVLNCYSTVNHNGVFNFTTVNIPSGVTVSFKKDTNNDPVTILASGDVTISGTIYVNGCNGGNGSGTNNGAIAAGAGGPGGFSGGIGGRGGWMGGAGMRGDGPGGGGGGIGGQYGNGAGGGFQTPGGGTNNGVAGGGTYGTANLTQLIGGSGGGGSGYYNYGNGINWGAGGGGGGGAILIATSGTLTINGAVYANGGVGSGNSNCNWYSSGAGGGSGGAIRLVADTFQGSGTISAMGGAGGAYCGAFVQPGGAGGNGYIRIETNHNLWTATQNITPAYSGALAPATLYPSNIPTLAITSINGVTVPPITTGDTTYPDVNLPYGTQNPVSVGIAASYMPLGTTVSVKVAPATGNPTTVTSTGLSGTTDSSTATADITLDLSQPSILTLSATFTPLALNGAPLYAGGERIKAIKVISTFGEKGSRIVYVTESGKEIPAKI